VTREARLLLATIGLSVTILLILAKFRFPERATPKPEPSPAPLARLASRPTYDELAAAIASLENRIAGSVTTIAVAGTEGEPPRLVPALRVRDDLVLAALDGAARLAAPAGDAGQPAIVARDRVRRVALVRVVKRPAPVLAVASLLAPGLDPRYVAVMEAAGAGPALRPLFVGRVDGVRDPDWNHVLMTLGGSGPIAAGAFVFALDGQFLGMVAAGHDFPTVVPAEAVFALANELAARAAFVAIDIGVALQPLTPALSPIVGMERGVVVAAVAADGASDGQLKPGDGIRAVDGADVASIEAFDDQLARRKPGDTVQLSVTRRGARVEMSVIARALSASPPPQPGTVPPSSLGVVLRARPPSGSEVLSVVAASPAARAGLRAGDVVTGIDDTTAPGPAPVARIFERAAPGTALLLFVRRGTTPLVLALEKP
jgi:hypothetical protein